MADREAAANARVALDASSVAVAPGEAPWTGEELAEQRTVLGAELSRIDGEVESLRSALSDVLRDGGDGAGDDQADTGAKAFERDQEMTLLANARDMLFQTRHALDRIEAGVVYVNRGAGATTGAWPGFQSFAGWKGSGSTGKGGLACKQRQERR